MKELYDLALSFATEEQELVEKVYYYLKAEGITVFFAPSLECQPVLSGKNQSEIFYEVFGLKSKYVALFLSQSYVKKRIPMEEASIAIATHREEGCVIPIFLDDASLPESLFDPNKTNCFKSNNAAEIAAHLASGIKYKNTNIEPNDPRIEGTMNIHNNQAEKQVFVQTMNGSIQL